MITSEALLRNSTSIASSGFFIYGANPPTVSLIKIRINRILTGIQNLGES